MTTQINSNQLPGSNKLLNRILLVGLIIIATWFFNSLVVAPLRLEYENVNKEIEKAKTENLKYATEMQSLQDQFGINPALSIQEKIAALQTMDSDLDQEIKSANVGFIEPDKMMAFLSDLTHTIKGLKLVSIEKLAAPSIETREPENKTDSATEDNAGNSMPPALSNNKFIQDALKMSEQPKLIGGKDKKNEVVTTAENDMIYKHQIQLRVQGKYADYVELIQKIEKMPMRPLWESIHLDSTQHPKSMLTLNVYTLSLQKEWLTF